jgi:hypothetical protein
MKLQCAPACQTCDQLDFGTRCPFDKDAPLVWQPGDLNAMFERMTTDPEYVKNYSPQILSQPPHGPWVVVLDNVVSEPECKRLIEMGGELGYNISKDSGKKKFDGSYEAYSNTKRTSTNAVRYVCHFPVSYLGHSITCLSSSNLVSIAIFLLIFIYNIVVRQRLSKGCRHQECIGHHGKYYRNPRYQWRAFATVEI